jgi:YbbR domain-containing protein
MSRTSSSKMWLRIISLVLGFALWAYISGSRQTKMVTKAFTVPIYFENITENVILMEEVFYEVNVQLRGSETSIRKLEPKDLYVSIDLGNKAFGVHSIPLTERMIHRPKGIQVVGITPNTVQFRIERKLKKLMPVRPTIVGSVADGFEIKKVVPTPPALEVEGPASEFQKRDYLTTEPIDVTGKSASFTTKGFVALKSDYLKMTKDSSVDVNVVIGEQTNTQVFRGIEVTLTHQQKKTWVNPTRINVIVSGPFSIVKNLKMKNFRVIVDCSGLSSRKEDYVISPSIEYRSKDAEQLLSKLELKTSPEMVNVRVF